MPRVVALLRAAVAGLALAFPGAARAAWPDRPVRVLVGLPSGTTVDLVARLLAGHLQEKLRQPFIVENKIGAQGLIAARNVANAPPDGYTLLLLGSIAALEITMKEGAGISEEFSYVSLVRHSPTYIGVTGKRAFANFGELIAWGHANPKKLSYGSIAKTLEFHLATINKAAGVEAVHVPFRGSAEASTALVAGDIDYYLDSPTIFEPLESGGRVRIMATTSATRSLDRPDIPSLAEAGVPGLDLFINYGLVGPKGLPDDVMKALNDGAREFAARPDIRERFIAMGQGVPAWSTPAEFRAQVGVEIRTMREAAQAVGYEPQ